MSTQTHNYNLSCLNIAEHFGAAQYNDFPDLKLRPTRNEMGKNILNGSTAIITIYGSNKGKNSNKNCVVYTDKVWTTSSDRVLDFSYEGLASAEDEFKTYNTIVIEHVFEYLEDVRPLLAQIRRWLIDSDMAIHIIPIDSSKMIYGYRNWSHDEFAKLLESAGLNVTTNTANKTVFFTVSCSKNSYEEFLSNNKLPRSTIELLLITTEHSGYRVTGGIGSYINECDHLYGKDAGILIIDNNTDLDTKRLHEGGWFAAQTFMSPERFNIVANSNFDTIADIVNEAFEALVCLYPRLIYVEAQEMLLYRAIESRRAGFLPLRLRFITVCHGSSFHLAKAKRDVIELENIHVAYREKFTLENSDYVVFPTEFLRNSYIDSGIEGLNRPTRITRRLPFDYTRLPEGKTLSSYKRLIYVGKTSTIKGFDLFLGTLLKLKEKNDSMLNSIEEVCIFATSVDIKEGYLRVMYEEVLRHYNVKILSLPRHELLQTLSNYSEDSLVLVTYKGDNHSMAVLEFMGVGVDFLAARAGGTPELIAEPFKNDYLVDPDPDSFADATISAFKNVSNRSKKIISLHASYRKEQEHINSEYKIKFFTTLPVIKINPMPVKNSHVYVHIQPNAKGDRDSSINTLKNQTRKVNSNETEHSYVMRLYEGDILHPRAIEWMSNVLDLNPDVDVVFGYESVWTYDGEKDLGSQYFTPYPPQLGSAFLQEKYGRRYCALFRQETLEEFTDWQNAILSLSKGGKCAVVPRLLFSLSELEGYNSPDILENFSKMSHALTVMPVFDAFIMNYQLKRLDDMYFGSKLFNHLEDTYVRRDDPRVLVSVTPQIRTLVALCRKVPTPVRKASFFAYRGARRVYRKLRSLL